MTASAGRSRSLDDCLSGESRAAYSAKWMLEIELIDKEIRSKFHLAPPPKGDSFVTIARDQFVSEAWNLALPKSRQGFKETCRRLLAERFDDKDRFSKLCLSYERTIRKQQPTRSFQSRTKSKNRERKPRNRERPPPRPPQHAQSLPPMRKRLEPAYVALGDLASRQMCHFGD